MNRSFLWIRILPLLAVWVAASAHAIDGVVEINQPLALAGGATPGDAPGFPVTLSSAGSYRLTGPLTVASSSTSGISVSAVGVEIDLNGFSIAGPGSCSGSGSTLVCPPVGSGAGVSGGAGVTVRNGTIRGFSNNGVIIGPNSRVTEMLLTENSVSGVQVLGESEISRCVVRRNGIAGIIAQDASNVMRNVVEGNGGTGISAGQASRVVENSIWGNDGRGIAIVGSPDGEGGIAEGNGIVANGDGGVLIDAGGLVLANSIKDNGGNGIGVVVGAAYGYNNVRGNTGSTITVTGGDIAPNVCEANLTCP
jgi:hypothetical protein